MQTGMETKPVQNLRRLLLGVSFSANLWVPVPPSGYSPVRLQLNPPLISSHWDPATASPWLAYDDNDSEGSVLEDVENGRTASLGSDYEYYSSCMVLTPQGSILSYHDGPLMCICAGIWRF